MSSGFLKNLQMKIAVTSFAEMRHKLTAVILLLSLATGCKNRVVTATAESAAQADAAGILPVQNAALQVRLLSSFLWEPMAFDAASALAARVEILRGGSNGDYSKVLSYFKSDTMRSAFLTNVELLQQTGLFMYGAIRTVGALANLAESDPAKSADYVYDFFMGIGAMNAGGFFLLMWAARNPTHPVGKILLTGVSKMIKGSMEASVQYMNHLDQNIIWAPLKDATVLPKSLEWAQKLNAKIVLTPFIIYDMWFRVTPATLNGVNYLGSAIKGINSDNPLEETLVDLDKAALGIANIGLAASIIVDTFYPGFKLNLGEALCNLYLFLRRDMNGFQNTELAATLRQPLDTYYNNQDLQNRVNDSAQVWATWSTMRRQGISNLNSCPDQLKTGCADELQLIRTGMDQVFSSDSDQVPYYHVAQVLKAGPSDPNFSTYLDYALMAYSQTELVARGIQVPDLLVPDSGQAGNLK